MKTHFLIFPIVFSDTDFETLTIQVITLKNLNFERLTSLIQCKQSIIYHIAHAVLDIQEILDNRNCKGYRYNSYCLNLSILKLTFVFELLKSKDLLLFREEISIIQSTIISLSSIITVNYNMDSTSNL